jgi:hypothetical protein
MNGPFLLCKSPRNLPKVQSSSAMSFWMHYHPVQCTPPLKGGVCHCTEWCTTPRGKESFPSFTPSRLSALPLFMRELAWNIREAIEFR